ncbi:MAG: Prolyl-tRNA synthetase, archaeal/eukaryal type [uncultured Acidimicrobiales bacterium]|uniref:Proline--tRNA ligase n=1 Tax=uncultured Acidimicrobiales bacterium TaxID=310071 RepID=A0A6J4H2Y3_9ACTN|nr:MAG: Prolyl-tRNA synthetase, archaeal/eukaryal type [uncultured Acidimicrobiales bacterium]
MAKVLTPQEEDFPRWYQDVVAKADLAENGPVRGTMVIKPWGYAVWELVQAELDRRIKAAGAKNAYFPLFIPESFLKKEAQHVEGFSPELAVVTHGGGEELAEPVVVRPTSETVINHLFAKWVQSHRDLPLLINQWANVVRWELRPRLFLRTSEFLWQEGHTCHATREEAQRYALRILCDVYVDTMYSVLGVPILVGRKPDDEKFAGADATYTCEGVMVDGKALQMGTSHELGQNFAKAFGITFQSPEGGAAEHVWQTSWGVSTRLIGALIMCHGDDAGLRLPPLVAPAQAVVLVVRDEGDVAGTARDLVSRLAAAGVRVELDDKVATSFGRRATDWELKGVPVRVEVGPRDLADGLVTVKRRVGRVVEQVALDNVVEAVLVALALAEQDLVTEATLRREQATVEASTLEEALEAGRSGVARVPWDLVRDHPVGGGVTVRCLQRADGGIPLAGDEPDLVAFLARAY